MVVIDRFHCSILYRISIGASFTTCGLAFFSTRISKYIHYWVLDQLIYPFQTIIMQLFSSKGIRTFSPRSTGYVITYLCWDYNKPISVKRAPLSICLLYSVIYYYQCDFFNRHLLACSKSRIIHCKNIHILFPMRRHNFRIYIVLLCLVSI